MTVKPEMRWLDIGQDRMLQISQEIVDYMLEADTNSVVPLEVMHWIAQTYKGAEQIWGEYIFGTMIASGLNNVVTGRIFDRGLDTLKSKSTFVAEAVREAKRKLADGEGIYQ